MANSYFRFKQFVIRQDRCAMKVGTDGTLLGAWVAVSGCRSILDIGTGTGLIALMLAQRNSEAVIDAVEIDGDACSQAKENADNSPFARRVCIIRSSFEDYASGTTSKYDLLVSNPPYFVRSLKNPDPQRFIARHTDSLSLDDILSKGRDLLTPAGRIALILPAGREEELKRIADANGLYITRLTAVVPLSGAGVKRVLAELSTSCLYSSCVTGTLIIEEACRRYSADYMELTKDFYLSF
jgi:tRNA1Val (adenine37-N6)-methyltransferase